MTKIMMILLSVMMCLGNRDESNVNKVIYFIGDSRTVGLEQSLTDEEKSNLIFIAEVGVGYNWLTSDTIAKEIEAIEPGSRVVVNLGVNDLYNVEKYVQYYELLEERGLEIYYMSVNPVIDGCCNASNEEIDEFNSYFQEKERYVDTNHSFDGCWIQRDGLHYTKEGYRVIYERLMEVLKENE